MRGGCKAQRLVLEGNPLAMVMARVRLDPLFAMSVVGQSKSYTCLLTLNGKVK